MTNGSRSSSYGINFHPFLTNIIWLYQHIILAQKKKKIINKLVINLEQGITKIQLGKIQI